MNATPILGLLIVLSSALLGCSTLPTVPLRLAAVTNKAIKNGFTTRQ
jgi:hypothetical protein